MVERRNPRTVVDSLLNIVDIHIIHRRPGHAVVKVDDLPVLLRCGDSHYGWRSIRPSTVSSGETRFKRPKQMMAVDVSGAAVDPHCYAR